MSLYNVHILAVLAQCKTAWKNKTVELKEGSNFQSSSGFEVLGNLITVPTYCSAVWLSLWGTIWLYLVIILLISLDSRSYDPLITDCILPWPHLPVTTTFNRCTQKSSPHFTSFQDYPVPSQPNWVFETPKQKIKETGQVGETEKWKDLWSEMLCETQTSLTKVLLLLRNDFDFFSCNRHLIPTLTKPLLCWNRKESMLLSVI